MKNTGEPYTFGSDIWPGVAKILEEQNELGEVLAKLIGSGGSTDHWTGDLRKKILDEVADNLAALAFLTDTSLTDDEVEYITERAERKFSLFHEWHKEGTEERLKSQVTDKGVLSNEE